MKTEFVEFDYTFLKLSSTWLSDPEIKKLTLTPDIDCKEQKKWFDSLKTRNDYYIQGVCVDGIPVGAVGIKNINYSKNEGEYWGYIGEKKYIGHGIGNLMIDEMCRVAKNKLLDSLYLHVACYNERAYKLYLKNGFVESDSSDGIILMRKNISM